MKLLVRLFLFFLPVITLAQVSHTSLTTATSKTKGNNVLTPEALSRELTGNYTKDIDKVRAIFNWITDNISYNVRPWQNAQRYASKGRVTDDDASDTGSLKSLSERVAMDVLERRIAFCDGYSRLFKTLCDYAGVRSEVVTGYTNVGSGRRANRFRSNHRWNAVYFDSAWHLLDATWASGYVMFGSDDFIKRQNDYYFLTPPQQFVNDHYPEDLQWTLLPTPPEMSEYKFSPFKTNAYIRKRISGYKPESGIIEAAVGDTLQFEVQTDDEDKELFVMDSAYVDTALIEATAALDSTKNLSKVDGSKITCTYVVSSPAVQWLQVVLKDEVIMRYRLKIRNNLVVAAN